MPRLNRIVELQEPVTTRDSFGGEVTTFVTRAEVWAAFSTLAKPTERYLRGIRKVQAIRLGRYEIRRPTVNFNELWRIVEGSRVWNVVGIDKEGGVRSHWGVIVKT